MLRAATGKLCCPISPKLDQEAVAKQSSLHFGAITVSALLYTPENEHFGIVPVEVNSEI